MPCVKTIPAFIDMHVHFREPGFEHKETLETGMAAAIKGGYGAVCIMPNTKPVADNPDVIRFLVEKTSKNKDIDVYPVAAVTKNLDSTDLVHFDELENAGAIAFSNDGLPILDKNVFKNALMSGKLILSHLEDEKNEVIWQIELFKEVQTMADKGLCPSPRLHFCHISMADTLSSIKNAKAQGFKVTCETAPHYFTFTKNDVTSSGVFKMNPPLREEADRVAVLEALKDGTIDAIATDHAPHTVEEKKKPYITAPNGIVGLETAFPLALRVLSLDEIVEKMCYNPAKILGVENRRETRVNLDETWVVKSAEFRSKCKISPYENMQLKGKVICQ